MSEPEEYDEDQLNEDDNIQDDDLDNQDDDDDDEKSKDNRDDQEEGDEGEDSSVSSEKIELKKQTETIQMQIDVAQLEKPSKCLLLRETKVQFEQAEFNNNNYKKIAEQYKQLMNEQKPDQFQLDQQTIRWRNKSNPTLGIESNAKLVEWDDGSKILFIGDKPFDLLPIKQVKQDSKIFSVYNNKYFLPQYQINDKVMVREHKTKY